MGLRKTYLVNLDGDNIIIEEWLQDCLGRAVKECGSLPEQRCRYVWGGGERFQVGLTAGGTMDQQLLAAGEHRCVGMAEIRNVCDSCWRPEFCRRPINTPAGAEGCCVGEGLSEAFAEAGLTALLFHDDSS